MSFEKENEFRHFIFSFKWCALLNRAQSDKLHVFNKVDRVTFNSILTFSIWKCFRFCYKTNFYFYFLPTEHSMSNRVPETRPLSRCSEPSRINVSSNGEDMAPETVSSPQCLSVLIFTHTANSVLLLPPVTSRPETHLLTLLIGRVSSQSPSTQRFHGVEAWLLTSFPHPLETQSSGTSAENQHILPLCFSVLLPDCVF